MFTNDDNLLTSQEYIENVLISDHTINIIGTNLSINASDIDERQNFCSTKILNYDLMGATDSDWDKLIDEYKNIDWDSILNKINISNIYSIDSAAAELVAEIENCVDYP